MAKKKNRWKKILWSLAVLMILTVLVVVFFRMVPEPPFAEVDRAGSALANARDNQAEIYADDLFTDAKHYYDSAMLAWKRENERFILVRDYTKVIRYSSLAVEKSEEALRQTRISSADLEHKTKNKLYELTNLLKEINNSLNRFPLPKEIISGIARGKLLLSEGRLIFKNRQYPEADKKLNQAEAILKSANNKALRIISDYFENHKQWKHWMEQTIAESREKKITAVLVDKYAGKCYVYKNGKKTDEFDAELGKRWVGDKRHKGDNTTPEGRYRIIKKKEGRSTKYYKALLIDYPNDEDKKRFHSAVANGTLPRNSKIGGLIEIHGHGGKGTDWTEGCVALTDSDMDKIYRLVSIGTPVTIIGSIAPFETIFNN